MENYKGLLQQTCQNQMRRLPIYDTQRHGTDNEPSWMVEIGFGDRTYKTKEAIAGKKRAAEQLAAKQFLDIIASEQETFLETDDIEEESDELSTSLMPSPQLLDYEKIDVPIELLTYSHTLKGGDSHPFKDRNCAINKDRTPKCLLRPLLRGWMPPPCRC